MILSFCKNKDDYYFDTEKPIPVSIPLNFNSEQPNAYDVPKAVSRAVISGTFNGDTRSGGSCNFEEYRFIAHCNTTHTECVGHISLERLYLNNILKETLVPAVLITIQPADANSTKDNYIPRKDFGDMLITQSHLLNALGSADKFFNKAIIIRTLPNNDSKKTRNYMKEPPPYFSVEAMKYLTTLGVEHLLVDIPSLDRTFDEGKLTAHHIFWNVPEGSKEVDMNYHSLRTVTEMIFVPDEIKDGYYILDLQTADFTSDASPSKPVIYNIFKK